MNGGWQAWAADLLLLAGLAFSSLAVLGVWRLPDLYMKLHAAAKVASLGVVSLALATALSTDVETAARAAMAAIFVVLTSAISSHSIARAAADRGDRMAGDSFDESGLGLDPADGEAPEQRGERGGEQGRAEV